MQINPLPQAGPDNALANRTLSFLVIGSPLLALAAIYSIRLLVSGDVGTPSTGEVINFSLPLFIALSVLIEGAGYSSTIFRGFLNKTIFARHRAAFLISPVLIFCLCLSAPAIAASILFLNSIYFMFHASMQNYGIFRFYEREAGGKPKSFPYYAFFMGINLLILFSGSTLLKGRLGSTSQFFGLEPMIPSAVFSFLAVYTEIGAFLGPVLPILFYASMAFLFFLPLLLRKDWVSRRGALFLFLYFLYWPWALWCSNPLEALFGHNIIHCAQTFGMTFRLERFGLRERASRLPLVASSGVLFFLLSLAVLVPGGILNTVYERVSGDFRFWELYSFPLLFLIALHQAARFTHFFTDGIIWRMPRGRTVKETSS